MENNKFKVVSIVGRTFSEFSLFLVVVALLSSCSPEPKATEVSTSRCVPASSEQLKIISVGVKDTSEGNSVKSGWAVKSNDFEEVWFVAVKIYGQGMENGTGPGLWAISGDINNPGMIISVDGFAKEFSSWPDASTTDAAITKADDGAQDALSCASND